MSSCPTTWRKLRYALLPSSLLVLFSSSLHVVTIAFSQRPSCFRTFSNSALCEAAVESKGSDENKAPQHEIDRRRNLAIISHPDSGKTTMTEKLLLYGGAIQQAGAVRMKAEQRGTASDFMEMEKERGISIRYVFCCSIRLQLRFYFVNAA